MLHLNFHNNIKYGLTKIAVGKEKVFSLDSNEYVGIFMGKKKKHVEDKSIYLFFKKNIDDNICFYGFT